MLTGTFVVSYITSKTASWIALLLLLAVHLTMNYVAVRAVCMRTLNRQRATIVFSHLIEYNVVLTPKQVSAKEQIFARNGILRRSDGTDLGCCHMGASMQDLANLISQRNNASGSFHSVDTHLTDIIELYAMERYVLWYDISTRQGCVVLKEDAKPTDHLRAWLHAWLISRSSGVSDLSIHKSSLDEMRIAFPVDAEILTRAGWDVDMSTLEIRLSTRISYPREL